MQCQHVFFQINALIFLEFFGDVVDQRLVEVLAAQEGIAVGRQHFKLMLAVHVRDFDNRYVKGAATEVVHGNLAVAFFLVHAERQRGRSRLVDDALHVQTGNAAGILGRLTLAVVEISRHGNHRLGDFGAQIILGGFFHLAQDFCRHLLRGHFLVTHFYPGIAVIGLDDFIRHQADIFLHHRLFKATANQPLDRVQRVSRVGDRLALGRRADQNFAVLGIRHHRGRGARPFRVFDHFRRAVFHHRHTRVGGAEVNSNNASHDVFLLVNVELG